MISGYKKPPSKNYIIQMKKIVLITAISLLLSSNVYAEKEHAHKKHGMSDDLFKVMDLDKDNSISLVEFKEIYKKHSLKHERENN